MVRLEDITIRRLQRADAEAVSRIEEEAFSMPWSKEAFLEMAEAEYAIYLVALHGDQIIGSCGVRNILGEGDITNVVIKREYRGMGAARKMLCALLAAGEWDGIREFSLEVRESNAPAIGLYRSLGFRTEGVRPRFYEKPVEDALVMWKRQEEKQRITTPF